MQMITYHNRSEIRLHGVPVTHWCKEVSTRLCKLRRNSGDRRQEEGNSEQDAERS